MTDPDWNFLLDINRYERYLPYKESDRLTEGARYTYIGTNGQDGWVYEDYEDILYSEAVKRGLWCVAYQWREGSRDRWAELWRNEQYR
jgi:hypothetical protein